MANTAVNHDVRDYPDSNAESPLRVERKRKSAMQNSPTSIDRSTQQADYQSENGCSLA